MSQQGEAAEQIVNMATNVTVKGVECVTNLAGKGAMSLATFLIATLKDQKKTQGRARMRAFHGKPTKVFVIKAKDMNLFAEEAKKYGILYAAVINKKQPDGLVDVVVNAADAAKVNRIAERFGVLILPNGNGYALVGLQAEVAYDNRNNPGTCGAVFAQGYR